MCVTNFDKISFFLFAPAMANFVDFTPLRNSFRVSDLQNPPHIYGTSHTATTSFFTHHLRLISLAAVIGAALPVAIWAKSRKSHLLSGAPLAGLLPQ